MFDVRSRLQISRVYRLGIESQYGLHTSIHFSCQTLALRTHSDSRNVSIIVNQTPLVANYVQPQNMIVDLICILIEATKRIDLIVPAVCDGSIDQACRSLSQCPGHLWSVIVHAIAILDRRVGHQERIIG